MYSRIMGSGYRPVPTGEGAAPRPSVDTASPFAEPKLPPPLATEPVEILRLTVRVRQAGDRDFLAVVQREGEMAKKLGGCRATSLLAAVQGVHAAAVEALREGATRQRAPSLVSPEGSEGLLSKKQTREGERWR
jgi:hypothetical protein